MVLIDDLILARIALSNLCDGFSTSNSSKNNILSIKIKILFLLDQKDLTPAELISALCIAKSNLANMLKGLIESGLVESYKNFNNSRNINYHITEQGRKELNEYKTYLGDEISNKISRVPELQENLISLSKNLSTIIEILKKDTL